MRKYLFATMASLFLFSVMSIAQETEAPVTAKFLLEGGLEYGGDKILKVYFTDGGDQDMRAGQGGYIAVGGEFSFANIKPLMVRTSIGYKYNTTAADNANIRLTRLPFTLMPYYKINDDFRAGVGITTHLGVKFKGDDFVDDVDFDSSLGPRFEFGYRWVALTYSALNYTSDQGEDVSASSIGVALSVTFPNK